MGLGSGMDFVLERSVIISRTKDELFSFFARAENLNLITPPWLNFQLLTPGPIQMNKGTKLLYRVRLHMIPIRWESEIIVWDPPNEFCDVQKKGPYRKWIHSHTFESHNEGTVMKDRVLYQVFGGCLVNWAFVSKDLTLIFDYRRAKILELFN